MRSEAPESEMMPIQDVAAALGVSLGTLYNWRVHGAGPPSGHVGSKVKYRRRDVENWIAERFEPAVLPPRSVAPAGALAAARYFPWAGIAEAVGMSVAEKLGATRHEQNVINNAIWAALDDAYTYLAKVGHDLHDNAEADAIALLHDALDEHLQGLREARTRQAEAS